MQAKHRAHKIKLLEYIKALNIVYAHPAHSKLSLDHSSPVQYECYVTVVTLLFTTEDSAQRCVCREPQLGVLQVNPRAESILSYTLARFVSLKFPDFNNNESFLEFWSELG